MTTACPSGESSRSPGSCVIVVRPVQRFRAFLARRKRNRAPGASRVALGVSRIRSHASSTRTTRRRSGPSSERQIASSVSISAGARIRSGRPRSEKQTRWESGKTRGGNQKTSLKTTDVVNLSVPGSKVKKLKILKVLKNPSNKDYERRGVISKGAILETEAGQCRVISRPGQDGAVNAILIK